MRHSLLDALLEKSPREGLIRDLDLIRSESHPRQRPDARTRPEAFLARDWGETFFLTDLERIDGRVLEVRPLDAETFEVVLEGEDRPLKLRIVRDASTGVSRIREAR